MSLSFEEQSALAMHVMSASKKDPELTTKIVINALQSGTKKKLEESSTLAENYRVGMLSALAIANPKKMSKGMLEHFRNVILVKGLLGCDYGDEIDVLRRECSAVKEYLREALTRLEKEVDGR